MMKFIYEKSVYEIMLFPQITSPRFPVVVKMGHAHSGMGKVVLECIYYFNINANSLNG